MRRFFIMLIFISSACLAAGFSGCSEPKPEATRQTGSGTAKFVPGAMDFHRAGIKYLQPNDKDYTLLQIQECYREAIPLFLKSYKAVVDAKYPMIPKRVYCVVLVYRKLAAVQTGLGDSSGAAANFSEALKWCDTLESHFHGRHGAYYYRATIYRLTDELEKAEQAATKDIEIRPNVRKRENVLLLEDIRARLAHRRYRVPLKKPEK